MKHCHAMTALVRRARRGLLALFLGLGLVTLVGAAEAVAALRLSNGYVREMPPGHPVSGAFLAIENVGKKPVHIVGARCACARQVEMHEHVRRDGMMRMQQTTSIEVAPGATFTFKPGEHHIMLISLTRPLRAGDQVELTLIDREGRAYETELPVVSLVNDSTPNTQGEHRHH